MSMTDLDYHLREGGMPVDMDLSAEENIKNYVSMLKAQVKSWTDTAARHLRNEEFYRGIVRKIGAHFGDAAKRSDDGMLQDEVLAFKVEPLVVQLFERIHAYEEAVAKLPQSYQDEVINSLAKG